MSSLDCLDLCRLCLVKDSVSVPIFGGEGDARQIFLKIAACLPVKVARDDKLPKKICDQCVCKIELCYEFWNTTVNSEKQLIEWLGGSGVEDKQNYVSDVLNPNIMKQEQSNENRLDGTVMQVSGHQSNMAIGMMGNLALNMPIIISTSSQQQISSVPMDTSCNSVQAAQPLPGPSSQTSHSQNQVNSVGQEEEESTEEDDNTDDDGDAEEGLPVKEESEEDVNTNRSIEPTTFVNVSLACDEAGPSGLQQQKISEMPEMTISQTTDGDPKSGSKNLQEIMNEKKPLILEAVKGFISSLSSSIMKEEEYSTVISPEDTFPSSSSNNKDETRTLTTFSKQSSLKQFETATLVDQECLSDVAKPEEKKFYKCEICSKRFKFKNLFEGHLVAHSDLRPYKCDICGKSFKRTNTLSVHRRIHTCERNFVCDVCGRAFVQASQLTTHQRRHFERYTRYCEICGKGFFTNAEIHGHMNVKHGAKEHVCHSCNKSFPNNHTLVRHLKVHDPNFKPVKHQCEFCGKTFAYKNSLVVHVKSHTGDNKYDCHLCGKSVSSKGSLQDHLRLHGGEKSLICDVCGKAFHKRTTLVVHKRTHTGERPYKCDTCGKSFTQHSTLVIHKRYHTGQRPYQCNLCNKSFVSRALLNAHNKVHVVNTLVVQST